MPDKFHVTIMPRASSDLAGLFEYIERSSPQNAAAVAQALLDAIDSLDTFPHRYKVHRSNRNPTRAVRSMPVPPFVIYYRVVEPRRQVEIITVRHGRQRKPRDLG